MNYKPIDDVCGMDEATEAEIEKSDRLVLMAVKDGKEKALISLVPREKKMLAFKIGALIAGTDYDFGVKGKD